VTVSPAASRNSAEPRIAAFVTRYFTAINNHDYQAYVSVLDSEERAEVTHAWFRAGYGTTTDSGATLTRITRRAGGGEAAELTFTSHQSPSRSPDKSSCDLWSITLYLIPDAGGYLIEHPPPGYQAHLQPCS